MGIQRPHALAPLRSALVLLTLALASSGCTPEDPPEPTPPQPVCPLNQTAAEGSLLLPAADDVAFAPREGWPADAPARQVGSASWGAISQLAVDPRGCIWMIRREGPDAISATGVLEIHGLGGQKLRALAWEKDVEPVHFVLHSNGDVTLFEVQRVSTRGEQRLRLRRLDARGRLLAERLFEDAGRPEERVRYATWDGSLATEPLEGDMALWSGSWSTHIQAVAQGDGLFFVAWTYGVKLYRLDASLQTLWDVQVMPDSDELGRGSTQEQLTLDERGNVLVAWNLNERQAEAYRRHFDRPLPWRGDVHAIAVQRYSPEGTLQHTQTFGHSGPSGGPERVRGIALRGGELLLGADVHAIKHDRPNDTLESELLLFRGGMEDGVQSLDRVLDVSREDALEDFKVDAEGACYLAGITDALQVDTNSLVEDGKGLILRTGVEGGERQVLTLPGPRNVVVQRIALTPDGGVVFAGTFDGPITHTPAGEGHQKTMLGFHRF